MPRLFILATVLVFVISIAATTVQADSYLKQVNYTGEISMMGQTQPAQYDTMEIWMTKDKSAVVTPSSEMTVLVLPTEGLMYLINHAEKKYAPMPLAIGDAVAEAMKAEGGDTIAQSVAGIAKGMMGDIKVTVTPTEETKTIGKWNSKKYDVAISFAMMEVNSETWATQDIKIDYSAYQACVNAMLAMIPGFENLYEEMKKIDGVVVEQIGKMKMMGMEIENKTTLVEYADKEAPAGTYELPGKDYKEVSLAEISQGQMGGM